MSLILLPKNSKGVVRYFSRRAVFFSLSVMALLVSVIAMFAGYFMGVNDLVTQKERLAESLRLAELQSRV